MSDTIAGAVAVKTTQGALKRIVGLTQFAMAHQDVGYYLNGMLFELTAQRVRTVATDGHRLALAEAELEAGLPAGEELQLIVPRKGVLDRADRHRRRRRRPSTDSAS